MIKELHIEKIWDSKTQANDMGKAWDLVNFVSDGVFYNTFKNKFNEKWKVGDVITVQVGEKPYKKKGKDGNSVDIYNVKSLSAENVYKELMGHIEFLRGCLVDPTAKTLGSDEPPPFDDSDIPF